MSDNDFSKLEETKHMLEWLTPAPYDAIVAIIKGMLNEQVDGTEVSQFSVDTDPQWLTAGFQSEEEEGQMVVSRCAVAFAFSLAATPPEQDDVDVRGIFTWAISGLEDREKAQQRYWMDLEGSMDDFGSEGHLKERLYFDHQEG